MSNSLDNKATYSFKKDILTMTNTTRKKLINDPFVASLNNYNDAFLKRHGLECHYI